ncbi:MAG: hypothetical protein K2P94_17125 [Rhodospirillaceae bacterium]|nr:hypothetical protein [Rhodospirillaceae bacterium]
MTKIYAIFLGLLLSIAAPVLAHGDMRVVGEVTAVDADSVDVKMRDGKIVPVALGPKTNITKDKVKADPKELTTGQFVVIEAHGDGYDDLVAVEIRLVPPPAK